MTFRVVLGPAVKAAFSSVAKATHRHRRLIPWA